MELEGALIQSLQLLIAPRTPMLKGFQHREMGIPFNSMGMPRRICQRICATTYLGYTGWIGYDTIVCNTTK